MNNLIRKRLLQLNPWFEDSAAFLQEIAHRVPPNFVARTMDMTNFSDPKKGKLIIGPRQSGKSTFMWSILAAESPTSVMFINGEEALMQEWCTSAIGMVRDLQEEFPAVKTIFFDEAQHIENVGLLIKGIVDARAGFNLFITGSSSYHLDDKIRESLAGRAERRVLLPFSMTELAAPLTEMIPSVKITKQEEIASRMGNFGSYPEVWFSDAPEHVLSTLLEAFVLRDASDRYKLKRPDAMRMLLQLLARAVGSSVNYSEIASHLGISTNTVRQYVHILEESFLIALIPSFAGGKRREITSLQRVHFIDMGIRNALAGSFNVAIQSRVDSGAVVEGLVFREIKTALPPGWDVHYWRTKGGAEVDFVLVSGSRTVGIEVKTTSKPFGRSSRSFVRTYHPEQFYIVSFSKPDSPGYEIEGTPVNEIWICDLAKELAHLALHNTP